MSISPKKLPFLLFLLISGSIQGQQGPDPYFQWFQSRTQASTLYDKGSRLYVFNTRSPLFEKPDPDSKKLAHLPAGCQVTTLSYPEDNPGPMQYRGYQDYWYEVSIAAPTGMKYRGYLWGGDLAKGWSTSDLDADGTNEVLLLGIHTALSRGTNQAALKMVKAGQVQLIQPTSNHCLSEECAVNVLLRVVPDRIWTGMKILEVSIMPMGCNYGMERNFYHWNGSRFTRVYHKKWEEQPTENFSPFVHHRQGVASGEDRSYVCQFGFMGKDFNPVWRCSPAENWSSSDAPSGKPSRAR